jgi:hypothetical protein
MGLVLALVHAMAGTKAAARLVQEKKERPM